MSGASRNSSSHRVDVGSIAPSITLRDQHGTSRTLDEFKGRPVVVYFYPKNNTPACTAEACGFRDEFAAFAGLNAAVIGISSDSVESHAAFARKHSLPFVLLSDEAGIARQAFQVPKDFGIFTGRVTYVIDERGVIRRIITSALNARKHVREALAALTPKPA